MSELTKRIGTLTIGTLWALAAGLPAVADDTELFTGLNTNTTWRPNILFIVDNSGSMATDVITQEPYDSATAYSGDCDATRVYWRQGAGDAPDCDGTDNWFRLSSLRCQAALDAFVGAGFYFDNMAQYDPNTGSGGRRWERLDNAQHTRVVECQDDHGIHGDGSGPRFARNGQAGAPGYWGDSGASSLVSWGNSPADRNYTIFSGNYINWSNSPTNSQTRMQIVQDVATDLLSSVNGVNVGLMHFNTNDPTQGGVVAYAMEDIATARAPMQAAINALSPETFTPLSETLFEARQYFAGDNMVYGASEP